MTPTNLQLDPRQIMNGIRAALHQRLDAIQPPFAARNSQRRARLQSQLRQPCDVGEVEAPETIVVRDVEEYGGGLTRLLHA
jgi:hypothetical protein